MLSNDSTIGSNYNTSGKPEQETEAAVAADGTRVAGAEEEKEEDEEDEDEEKEEADRSNSSGRLIGNNHNHRQHQRNGTGGSMASVADGAAPLLAPQQPPSVPPVPGSPGAQPVRLFGGHSATLDGTLETGIHVPPGDHHTHHPLIEPVMAGELLVPGLPPAGPIVPTLPHAMERNSILPPYADGSLLCPIETPASSLLRKPVKQEFLGSVEPVPVTTAPGGGGGEVLG
uniref:Uncharacterized protein n=1 Tax=Anopheles albimanus TaxID=7167 RepID=A0A182FJN7_ANOAL